MLNVKNWTAWQKIKLCCICVYLLTQANSIRLNIDDGTFLPTFECCKEILIMDSVVDSLWLGLVVGGYFHLLLLFSRMTSSMVK